MHEKGGFFTALVLSAFIVLTIPRVISVVYNFTELYTSDPKRGKLVSHTEMEALEFIRTATPTDLRIQTHINNPWDQESPYSVFFAQRESYLTGTRPCYA